jgi:hypothetical protein
MKMSVSGLRFNLRPLKKMSTNHLTISLGYNKILILDELPTDKALASLKIKLRKN